MKGTTRAGRGVTFAGYAGAGERGEVLGHTGGRQMGPGHSFSMCVSERLLPASYCPRHWEQSEEQDAPQTPSSAEPKSRSGAEISKGNE